MSKIEWTDQTLNPAVGCSPVSPACDNCYAVRMATRLAANPKTALRYDGVVADGSWTGRVNLFPEVMEKALRRKRPTRFFVGSMTDLFHPNIPLHFLDKIFAYMCVAPQHVFQILTKRPERMREYASSMYTVGWKRRLQMQLPPELQRSKVWRDCNSPVANVWLGVTAENQLQADKRIPALIETPAAVRFVSVEPCLGEVHLEPYLLSSYDKAAHDAQMTGEELRTDKLDWVICGGETGPGSRPMHPDWARSLREQCDTWGTPFFFKQWGGWGFAGGDCTHFLHTNGALRTMGQRGADGKGEWPCARVGKKKAGHLLDGREWREFPKVELK